MDLNTGLSNCRATIPYLLFALGCAFWNLGDGGRDWMPEARLEAISISLLNKDSKNPTQRGDAQDAKEGKNSKAIGEKVRLAGLADV